ncbi:hypothetical protein H311_00061, partial [Anncaliia algerae PRA109]
VLGLVERSEKRKIIYIPLADRKKETLIKIIRKFVLPGSTIYTDCWKGYLGLNEYFNHHTLNHSVSFVNENTGVHTNTIESNWPLMKRNVPIRWRTKKKYFFYYLLQFNKETEIYLNL